MECPLFVSPVSAGVVVSTSEAGKKHMHYNAPVRCDLISYVMREESKVYLDAHVTRVHQVSEFIWKPCIRFHLNDSSASDVCWHYDTEEERDLRYFRVLKLLGCTEPEEAS